MYNNLATEYEHLHGMRIITSAVLATVKPDLLNVLDYYGWDWLKRPHAGCFFIKGGNYE